MRNKGVVIVLAIVISLLCIYYLSFTFVSRQIQQEATEIATDNKGTVNLLRRQTYLDSLWNKPVYNLFGKEYTYKDVKENELSLGLDLQGGMHVVLEVSPADIIRALSVNPQDPKLSSALSKARQYQKDSQEDFTALFYRAFKEEYPDEKLATWFASASTKNRVSLSDSDDKVLDFLKTELDDAIN